MEFEKKSIAIVIQIILVLIVVAIPAVSALEFDNVKTYNPIAKEITITNSFLGIPTSEIAKVRLDSELVTYVMPGKDRLVAQFTINANDDTYRDALEKIELINIRTGKVFDRTVKYKVLSQKIVEKNVYDFICDEKKLDCTTKVIGTYFETEDTWADYNSKDISKGEITIGLFTDVYADDYVEWIPTLFGVEINEWAIWTSGLNVGLLSYYRMDNTYTDARTGAFNLTDSFNTTGRFGAGKIGTNGINGVKILEQYVNITGGAYASVNGTINLWMMNNSATSAGVMANQSGNAGGDIYTDANGVTWLLGGDSYVVTKGFSANTYHMFTIVYNATGLYGYLDGALNTSQAGKYRNMSGNGPWMLGRDLGGTSVNTAFDELSFWNRSLSATEVTQLYNGGSGITYDANAATSLLATSLNFPPTSAAYPGSVTFNCSAESDYNLTNISLKINNAINYTLSLGTVNRSEVYITIPGFTPGYYNWTCTAWDSATPNQVNTPANRTFLIDTTSPLLRITAPTGTITLPSNVSINLIPVETNIGSCWYSINAGTNTTIAGCKNYSIASPPLGSNSLYVYMNDTAGNKVYNTTLFNILPTFAKCNDTFNTTALNVTFLDEVTNTNISGRFDTGTSFQYWLDNSLVNRTYTYYTTDYNQNISFCLYPNHANMTSNYSLYYSANGFPQRSYSSGASFSNATTNLSLSLLSTADGVYSTYTTVAGGAALSGVSITAQKIVGATYTTVASGTTDSAGAATFFLNPNYDHLITASKTGYSTAIVTIRPTQSAYTIMLTGTGTNATYSNSLDGVYYFRTPASGIVQPGTVLFKYNVTALNNNAVKCKLILTNTSKYHLAENYSNASVSGRECYLELEYTAIDGDHLKGYFLLDLGGGYVQLEGDGDYMFILTNYSSWGTVKAFFTDLSSMNEFGTGMKAEFSKIVFFFFGLAIVFSYLNVRVYQFDTQNPGGFLFILPFIILVLSIGSGINGNGFFYIEDATPFGHFGDNFIVFFYSLIMSAAIYFSTTRRNI